MLHSTAACRAMIDTKTKKAGLAFGNSSSAKAQAANGLMYAIPTFAGRLMEQYGNAFWSCEQLLGILQVGFASILKSIPRESTLARLPDENDKLKISTFIVAVVDVCLEIL